MVATARIFRMASEGPGPGQQYAIQAREHIETLRRARPGIVNEIRWCPAHKEVTGIEKADGWAGVPAEEPEAHGWGSGEDAVGKRVEGMREKETPVRNSGHPSRQEV